MTTDRQRLPAVWKMRRDGVKQRYRVREYDNIREKLIDRYSNLLAYTGNLRFDMSGYLNSLRALDYARYTRQSTGDYITDADRAKRATRIVKRVANRPLPDVAFLTHMLGSPATDVAWESLEKTVQGNPLLIALMGAGLERVVRDVLDDVRTGNNKIRHLDTIYRGVSKAMTLLFEQSPERASRFEPYWQAWSHLGVDTDQHEALGQWLAALNAARQPLRLSPDAQ